MVLRGVLTVIETHPIQYHAPVWRCVQQQFGIPVTVIYGSDFSVQGYQDREFGTTFAWDTDLLSGYTSKFLSRVGNGGATSAADARTSGLRQLLWDINPAAILLTGYSPRFYRLAAYHAWRTSKPLLFRGETTDHAAHRSSFKRILRDNALRIFYSRCDKLLYVGKRSKQHFERLGVTQERLAFSPYCVDTTPFLCDEADRSRFRAQTREEIRALKSDLVILFSGKMSYRKGPDLLAAAVKRLPHAIRSRFLLLFVGDGKLRQSVLEELNREPRVRFHFTGFKNQRELSPYFQAADIFVLPSRYGETWGLVVNEALHHGLPAVVSDAVGCAPDLIEPGFNGEIFQSGSAEALGAALSCAIRVASVEEARQYCRAKVSKYTIEMAARSVAQSHEEVVEHANRN